MSNVLHSPLPGVLLIKPRLHRDSRGFFMESYRKNWLRDLGINDDFVQHNRSTSNRYVLRGLHYQLHCEQAKLVQVIRGSVWDVAVDVRVGSPTFGQWFGTKLSGDEPCLMYIPKGFAHGFLVLSDEADFSYLCSEYYHPESEKGIRWNCGKLSIDWPIPQEITPELSEKDALHPGISDISIKDLPVFQLP